MDRKGGNSYSYGGGRRGDEGAGLPAPVGREFLALQQLKGHPNIVSLLDVYPGEFEVVLVFDLLPSDLEIVIREARAPLHPSLIKGYMDMLLRALQHCHCHGVLHRDIKPANCLLSTSGLLQLGDFGLARPFSAPQRSPMSHQVATRWYRAPELLFGTRWYDDGVDTWGAGVIFAELLSLAPLFPGHSDIDQLFRVLQILG